MRNKSFVSIIVLFVFIASIFACNDYNDRPVRTRNNNVSITAVATTNLGDDLDLRAVQEIAKGVRSASEFEQSLNNSPVNNLDLDGDGSIDYISVTEYDGGAGVRGFRLTTSVNGDIQEIATIELKESPSGGYDVQAYGNEYLYGPNHYYHSHWGLTDALLVGWLFRPHVVYVSPFVYSRPATFTSRTVVNRTVYKTQVNKRVQGGNYTRDNKASFKSASTTSTKPAPAVLQKKKNLEQANAGRSQFNMGKNKNEQLNATGFGNRKTSNNNTSSSLFNSKKSNSGFGGGSGGSTTRRSGGFGGGSSRSGGRRR